MKQPTSTPVATLTPAAIAYLLGIRPIATQRVTVGTKGPQIQLVRS